MDCEPRKRILLVDDDDVVREFTALSLRRSGYVVIEAENAQAALRVFKERGPGIDLLLTDMVMPGLFGDQLALRLLELRPDLPVIFVSGNPPGSLEAAVHLEEGRNFLRKPFSVDDLRAALFAQLGSEERK